MNKQDTITIAMAAVCRAFGVTEADLTKRDRHRRVADARMAFCLVLSERGIDPETAAKAVGRTRANALHAARAIAAVAETDKDLAASIGFCRAALDGAERELERLLGFRNDGKETAKDNGNG